MGKKIKKEPLNFIEKIQDRILEKIVRKKIKAQFGGKIEDGFDVIVPSLPGFGFSTPIKKALGPRKIGKILNKFMVKNLDYKNYIVQGGDWGATIASWIGFDSAKYCKGIHINCLPIRHPKGPKNNKEKKWEKKFNFDQIMQEGYRTQQATKPQSLSYAMIDSPVGTAAWILEKFHGWSDLITRKQNDHKTVVELDRRLLHPFDDGLLKIKYGFGLHAGQRKIIPNTRK